MPGGWGVATGQTWKPIELPKTKAPTEQRGSQRATLRQHTTTTGGKSQQKKQQQQQQHQQQSKGTKRQQQPQGAQKARAEATSVSSDAPTVPLPVAKETFMKVAKGKLTKYHAIVFPTGK